MSIISSLHLHSLVLVFPGGISWVIALLLTAAAWHGMLTYVVLLSHRCVYEYGVLSINELARFSFLLHDALWLPLLTKITIMTSWHYWRQKYTALAFALGARWVRLVAVPRHHMLSYGVGIALGGLCGAADRRCFLGGAGDGLMVELFSLASYTCLSFLEILVSASPDGMQNTGNCIGALAVLTGSMNPTNVTLLCIVAR